MKRVTRTTFNQLNQIRHEKNKKAVILQKKLKNGSWGKPREYEMFGSEHSTEEVITRLEGCNPGDTWRIAE